MRGDLDTQLRQGSQVWNHLSESNDTFPETRIVVIGTTELKCLQTFCTGRTPVILPLSLYVTLKPMYPKDVGVIALGGRMTSEMAKWDGSIRRNPFIRRFPFSSWLGKSTWKMFINIATLKARDVRDRCKPARLLCDLQSFGVDVDAIQESQFFEACAV